MTRNEFKMCVAAGTITPEQTREILIEMAMAISSMATSSGEGEDLARFMTFKPSPSARPTEKEEAALRSALEAGRGVGFFCRDPQRKYIVIHWPSFFMRGFSHPRTMQTKALWLFQSLIRRRSPLLFSLLRRKLLTETSTFEVGDEPDGKFNEEAIKDVIPVSPEEVMLFEKIAKQFCGMPALSEMATTALIGAFRNAGFSTGKHRNLYKQWRDSLPPNSPLLGEVMLLPRHELVDLRDILQRGREISVLDAPAELFGFGAVRWNKKMFDVLTIPHYAHPDGSFGVCRRPAPGGAPGFYMLVNIPLLIKQLAREDMFSWAGELYSNKMRQLSEDAVIEKVKVVWDGQYPMLTNTSGERVGYESIWPTAKRGDVYAVPVEFFEEYRKSSRKMESMRAAAVRSGRPREINRRPSLTQVLQFAFGPIEEAGGATFLLRATFRRGEVYVSPGWEADLDEEFFRNRNYSFASGTPTLLDGIIRNESTGEYYYSLAKYVRFEGTPIGRYPELREAMYDYLRGQDKDGFRRMYHNIKRNPTQDIRVVRNAKVKSFRDEKVFSTGEDQIIIRDLRPGKLGEVMAQIQEIDETKTRSDVVRRSYTLREQLIADGEYLLVKLPHVNYSAKLGKRLSDLKAQKEREKLEEAKQTSQSHNP